MIFRSQDPALAVPGLTEAGVIAAAAAAFVLVLLHTLGKTSLMPTHEPGY